MAQETKDKDRKVTDEDEAEGASDGDGEEAGEGESRALARAGVSINQGDDGEGGEPAGAGGDDDEESTEESEEDQAAAQLGVDRYVLAGFFAAGLAGAFVIGRAIQGMWTSASNKDWFSQNLPRLAAVSDDDKGAYSIVLAGLIAVVATYRVYQKPDVRTWADDVAAELQKVVWPSRKDVTSSTVIVIVASTVATVYLTLLDRLWAFVTNIVYGDGS
jgi:preprotein translocase subunit SecE